MSNEEILWTSRLPLLFCSCQNFNFGVRFLGLSYYNDGRLTEFEAQAMTEQSQTRSMVREDRSLQRINRANPKGPYRYSEAYRRANKLWQYRDITWQRANNSEDGVICRWSRWSSPNVPIVLKWSCRTWSASFADITAASKLLMFWPNSSKNNKSKDTQLIHKNTN